MSNLKTWEARARALKKQKESAEQGLQQADLRDDIAEASDRCGMDSRHSLSGVVLVETETGDEVGVQYHSICSRIRFIATRGILFQFSNEEGAFDVEISGDGSEASVEKLRMISRQLTWAKRAVLHSNGSTVKVVSITKVEEPEEEP